MRHYRAFTLIELAIVLAISGLMVGFVLKANQSTPGYSDNDCKTISKGQLVYIQGAIDRFARSNDRLPMPARRWVGVDSPAYGREAPAGDLTQAGGVTFGALPFQVLGIPASNAGDCWGNKYTYMVTTALTTSASSGGFLDRSIEGNISRKVNAATAADTKIAYAVISHGPDGVGAVKINYDDSDAGTPDRKWCSGGTTLNEANCLATAAALMDAPYNDGKDAATTEFFDDILIAAGKPKSIGEENEYFVFGWGTCSGQAVECQNLDVLMPVDIRNSGLLSQLDTGGTHACGLDGGGNAWCWGGNQYGQLGDNTDISRLSPVPVAGGLTFSRIVTGGNSTCGLTNAGVAYCWGYNNYGQLGTADNINKPVPTAVNVSALPVADRTFSTIVTGSSHVCTLTAAGKAYCWGWNATYGQVGDNTDVNQNRPKAVSGGLTFATIDAYTVRTCGLTTGNALYCWGANSAGQVGNNTTAVKRKTPGQAAGSYASFSMADNNTCALTAAGAAYCWGFNARGGVGSGVITGGAGNQVTPVAVVDNHIFRKIYSWQNGACGITTSDDAYCWGNNVFGQLGTGPGTSGNGVVNVPAAYTLSPKLVVGGLKFTSLSISYQHSCGITTTGQAYCWGANTSGALGNVAPGEHFESPIPVHGGYNVTEVAVGSNRTMIRTADGRYFFVGSNTYGNAGNHTAERHVASNPFNGSLKFASISNSKADYGGCGITKDGAAYCWGFNDQGELGDGTTTIRRYPTAVLGGHIFTKIAIGTQHSCGVTKDAEGYCWGYNYYGALGDGSTNNSYSPVAVIGGANFKDIVTGATHSCGLTSADQAHCWGGNYNGQLGNNSSDYSSHPTPAAVLGPNGDPPLTFSSITAGNDYNCGLTPAGSAYCWGNNTYGQIGNGTSGSDQLTPTAVLGPNGDPPLTFSSITAGTNHTCGITTGNTSYCWGQNGVGQLGNGISGGNSLTPTLVSGGHSFTKLTLGGSHSCGLLANGQAYCWGMGGYDQLGFGISGSQNIPRLVQDSGNNPKLYKHISAGMTNTIALAEPAESCDTPWVGSIPNTANIITFQSVAPTGSCTPEYRTCTNGTLSGTYIHNSCTPGCDGRAISWGTSPTCTATAPSLAGGGSTSVPTTSPNTAGSITASCSATGVLTLSGGTCTDSIPAGEEECGGPMDPCPITPDPVPEDEI